MPETSVRPVVLEDPSDGRAFVLSGPAAGARRDKDGTWFPAGVMAPPGVTPSPDDLAENWRTVSSARALELSEGALAAGSGYTVPPRGVLSMPTFPAFTSWEGRPAVALDASAAVAILEPGGAWEPVEAWDVLSTGAALSPDAFARKFGELPPLPEASAVRGKLANASPDR